MFSRWTALRLATEQGDRPWEECKSLLDTVQQVIIEAAQDKQLCEELLETLFEETFDILSVDVEDGSIEEVSHLLYSFVVDSTQGNWEKMQSFLNQKSTSTENGKSHMEVLSSLAEQGQHDASSSCVKEQPMMVEESGQGPIVDEEGFELVRRRRRNR